MVCIEKDISFKIAVKILTKNGLKRERERGERGRERERERRGADDGSY